MKILIYMGIYTNNTLLVQKIFTYLYPFLSFIKVFL